MELPTKESWQEEVSLGLTDKSFELYWSDAYCDFLVAENNRLIKEISKLKHELYFRRIIG
jgi:hypothetical protein